MNDNDDSFRDDLAKILFTCFIRKHFCLSPFTHIITKFFFPNDQIAIVSSRTLKKGSKV